MRNIEGRIWDENILAGYGIKISWQDRDALISTGGMRIHSFEIDSGVWDLNSK